MRSDTFLLPHLAECLGRRSPHARLSAQRVLDALDPAHHLAFDRWRVRPRSLQPFEIFHPDQGCLRTPTRRQDDALSTMGGIVHQGGQTIAGFSQTDVLHQFHIRHRRQKRQYNYRPLSQSLTMAGATVGDVHSRGRRGGVPNGQRLDIAI
jgi:hypothetical protein